MLFNSYTFVVIFLPIVVLGFIVTSHYSHRAAVAWSVIASLVFYGYWNPPYVILLLFSITANFLIGRRVSLNAAHRQDKAAQAWTILGVILNLGLLCYYKYANFFVENTEALLGAGWEIESILLPIGISFYTFTQIAYLVDCRKSIASSYNLLDYTLFVSFFPQLIAGPILHHKEIVPQLENPAIFRVTAYNLSIGLTIFAIGLFKKTVLADGIAPYATPVFSAVDSGLQPDLLMAWGGALAYTFQLYFDFSGYSDMAIGLSRMFGIVLPLNFASPYKAGNIREFWRNWHITLSRFLRDYLFIPLGGSRRGPLRRACNLFLTMLLGGMWHGAGWNYIFWGAIHGACLVINHLWREAVPSFGARLWQRWVSWLMTFTVVVLAWVFFRAETLDGALRMFAGMSGFNGMSLPNAIMVRLGSLGDMLIGFGIEPSLGGGSVFLSTWCWVVSLLLVVLVCPNTQQIVRELTPANTDLKTPSRRWSHWKPNARWAVASGVIASVGLVSLSRVSEFLYFQF